MLKPWILGTPGIPGTLPLGPLLGPLGSPQTPGAPLGPWEPIGPLRGALGPLGPLGAGPLETLGDGWTLGDPWNSWGPLGTLGDPWGPLGTGFGSTWFGRCFAFTGPRPLPTSVRDPDPNSGRVPIRFAQVHILEVSSESQISHKTHMILPVSLAKFQSC